MALSFTGSMKFNVQGSLSNTIDLGSRSYNITYNKGYSLSNGTGADQANIIWSDTRTISASSNDDLDLAGGLTDAYGATITFTKIKGILVYAYAENSNILQIGGAASNAFVNWVASATDIINLRPGGSFGITVTDATAYAVSAGTGDILRLTNGGAGSSVTYDIMLIGVQ